MLFKILFVFYCAEAGLLLTLLPWTPAWEQIMRQIPIVGLQAAILSPLIRGATTGFGLVHILWGTHDIVDLLAKRRVKPS
ncbi:MAG: hypothetical protein V3S30_11515 [Thermoanaerobaculia bacterium]